MRSGLMPMQKVCSMRPGWMRIQKLRPMRSWALNWYGCGSSARWGVAWSVTWKEVLLNKAWIDVNVETLPGEACTWLGCRWVDVNVSLSIWWCRHWFTCHGPIVLWLNALGGQIRESRLSKCLYRQSALFPHHERHRVGIALSLFGVLLISFVKMPCILSTPLPPKPIFQKKGCLEYLLELLFMVLKIPEVWFIRNNDEYCRL